MIIPFQLGPDLLVVINSTYKSNPFKEYEDDFNEFVNDAYISDIKRRMEE